MFQLLDLLWTVHKRSIYRNMCGLCSKGSRKVPEKVHLLEFLIFFLDTFWTLEVLAKSPHNLVSVTTL